MREYPWAACGTAIIWMLGDLMHLEILVEDQSGKIALESILPKIIGSENDTITYMLRSFKGIGHLPKNLHLAPDPKKKFLLHQLPALLRGYGKGLDPSNSAVIVVVDLDDKNCVEFKRELVDILNTCDPKPVTLFRIAIEEGESWFLGDRNAIMTAYPNARTDQLDKYTQDEICGTWEKLADAIYPGGSVKLKSLSWIFQGRAKCEWADRIGPHLNIDANLSKSFQVFRDGVRKLTGINP